MHKALHVDIQYFIINKIKFLKKEVRNIPSAFAGLIFSSAVPGEEKGQLWFMLVLADIVN